MLKKIAFSIVLVVLVVLGAQPASADGTWQFWMSEGGRGNFEASHITRFIPQGGGFGSDATCYTMATGDCSPDAVTAVNGNLWAQIRMPYCESTTQDYCVESAQIYHDGDAPTDATYVGEAITNMPHISADAAHGIPDAGQPLIFNSATESSLNTGSHDFMVQVFINYTLNAPDYVASIAGVKISAFPVSDLGGGNYVAQDFQQGTRVGLSVRMPNEVGGWFKGRVADARMTIAPFDSADYRIQIDALNVSIPEPQVNLDAQQFAAFQTAAGHDIYPGGTFHPNEGISVEGDGDFYDLDLMKPFANDTNYKVDTAWYLTSFASGLKPECQASGVGLTALVATNAAVYTGAPPTLDSNGLSYRVGGLHFMPDGVTAAQGSYDLTIREDVARCIYGLPSSGDLYATINVTDGATANPATSTFTVADGYVHFSVSGFHFSQPVITTKLSSVKPQLLQTFGSINAKFAGKLASGKTLKLMLSGQPSSTRTTVQWYAGGKKIAGATSATLKVTKALVGKKISATVSLAKAGYTPKKLIFKFN